MDTVADSLEGLLVAAALHHDVLTAAGQHLAAPLLIPDTGHEPLPQPFPVAVLESLHVCLHTVLFQNGSDLPRADPQISPQLFQDLHFRLQGQERLARRPCPMNWLLFTQCSRSLLDPSA